MLPSPRVSVASECITKYNELKLGKEIKYIIYKLSDDYKEIVVEDYSSDKDWDTFRNKLLNAKASYKNKEGKGPRYAVYDFQWDLASGEGTRCVSLSSTLSSRCGTGKTDIATGTRLSSFHGLLMRGR